MNSNSLLWFFAILFLAGGNGLWGGNRVPMGPAPATQQDVNEAVNNQAIQTKLADLGVGIANTNFETAKTVFDQNLMLQNQNNTNLINLIQGFNAVTAQVQNQTNVLSQQVAALGAKLDTCCCEIKTQMLQYRLDDATAKNVQLEAQISNLQQTQTILGQMGRWVGWAGSGSQTATAAAG